MYNKSQTLGLCRICMKKNLPNVSFGSNLYSDKNETVLDALRVVIGSEMLTSDTLPKYLCSVCFVHLQISYNLKTQFLETQRILLQELQASRKVDIPENRLLINNEILDSTEKLSEDSSSENNQIIISQIFSNGTDVISITSPEQSSNSDSPICKISTVSSEQTETSSETEETPETDSFITNIIEQHECSACDFKTVNISNLKIHMSRVHGRDKLSVAYGCRHCNCSTFDTNPKDNSRSTHKDANSASETEPLKCDTCEFSTNKPSELKTHVTKIHDDWKVFKCKTCAHLGYSLHHHELHMSTRHNYKTSNPRARINSNQGNIETLEISSDEEDTNVNNKTNGDKESSDRKTSRKRPRNDETLDNEHSKETKKGDIFLECGICGGSSNFITTDYSIFVRHGKSYHPHAKEMNCRICAYRTYSQKHFNFHLREAHTQFWRGIGQKYGITPNS